MFNTYNYEGKKENRSDIKYKIYFTPSMFMFNYIIDFIPRRCNLWSSGRFLEILPNNSSYLRLAPQWDLEESILSSHLSENVVHGLGGAGIVLAQDPQQPEHFDLQEGVGDSRHIVLRRIARHDQVLGTLR
jgi:hypothetical protein